MPIAAEPDLPTRALNYLQEHERGDTTAGLAKHFGVPHSIMLVALNQLLVDNCVTLTDGVWAMKRDAAK